MLRVMHDKRLVRRRRGRQGYLWSAAVTRDQAAKPMIHKLVDRVFDGSAGRLVSHLVEAGDLTAEDLEELRKLVDQETKTSAPGKKGGKPP